MGDYGEGVLLLRVRGEWVLCCCCEERVDGNDGEEY